MVKIDSSLIPQADIFGDVLSVVEAVHQGVRTFQDVSRHIDKVERQGRYYRRAAEILGLIKNEHNYSRLTPLGRRYFASSAQEKEIILLSAVLNARIFQRLVPFLELHPEGVTRNQIESFMTDVTVPVGQTMHHRRVSSVLNWLDYVKILYDDNGRYKLKKLQQKIPLIEYGDEAEPLIPKTGELQEYQAVQARMNAAKSSITVLKDQAASERANEVHIQLVNLVAERIRHAGGIPRSNQFIDLATRVERRPYIFEMKSFSLDSLRSQIRLGLSQLLEYRYLQSIPKANLVLVIERQLPSKESWLKDYLEKDRKVRLVWDGKNELYASPETRDNLSFLWAS